MKKSKNRLLNQCEYLVFNVGRTLKPTLFLSHSFHIKRNQPIVIFVDILTSISVAGVHRRHQVLCEELIHLAREVSLQKTARLQSLRRQVQVQSRRRLGHMGRFWQEQRLELLPDLEACCKPQTENRKPQPNTAT